MGSRVINRYNSNEIIKGYTEKRVSEKGMPLFYSTVQMVIFTSKIARHFPFQFYGLDFQVGARFFKSNLECDLDF